MWTHKYGRFTVQQRWDQMIGKNDTTTDRVMRLSVLAAAMLTASDPSASYYIAPHLWVIGYLLWYWYPT